MVPLQQNNNRHFISFLSHKKSSEGKVKSSLFELLTFGLLNPDFQSNNPPSYKKWDDKDRIPRPSQRIVNSVKESLLLRVKDTQILTLKVLDFSSHREQDTFWVLLDRKVFILDSDSEQRKQN
jgi:hypothetical protein